MPGGRPGIPAIPGGGIPGIPGGGGIPFPVDKERGGSARELDSECKTPPLSPPKCSSKICFRASSSKGSDFFLTVQKSNHQNY